MSESVYGKLRERLDQFSVGFPETKSGVEIEILKRLFTEEEAEMFLDMSQTVEAPESVAARTGRNPDETARLLDQMADRGLLFRMRKNEQALYAAVPFVVGVYEFQVKDMDKELADLCEQYFNEALNPRTAGLTALMRPIPVNRSIDVAWRVASYDDARDIIRSKDPVAVAPCICRVQQHKVGNNCEKPLEVCFMFGSHAQYYVERGMGRYVTHDEAFSILDECDKAGLVTQPFNAQNPGGMCNCCGDCCAILRALKLHPRPVEVTVCNYSAQVDAEKCVACETCVERCQMDAITMTEDSAEVNPDRCIGCGLCVTTCPTEALTLVRKSDDDLRVPPARGSETYMRLAQERGISLK